MLIQTVSFAVIISICVSAKEIERGTLWEDIKIFNQLNPISVNEISNKVKRNALDASNLIPESDSKANLRQNLLHNIFSALPSQDTIKYLQTLLRTKRSIVDYDSNDNQKNIDPKIQLEQIASRNFAPNAYNEDQRRKLFFSQLFSMIDNDENSNKAQVSPKNVSHHKQSFSGVRSNEEYTFFRDSSSNNNDSLAPKDLFEADVEDLYSGKSQPETTEKYKKSNDLILSKTALASKPMTQTKQRRGVQESNSSQPKINIKFNTRPERQLGELINDDSTSKQFYKFSQFATRRSDENQSMESSVEEQLTYGPTVDDAVQTTSLSSPYTLITTTNPSMDRSNERNLEVENYDSSETVSLNSNSSTINLHNIDKNILSKTTLDSLEYNSTPATKILYHKINMTDQTLTTSTPYLSNVEVLTEVNSVRRSELMSTDNNTNNNNEISKPNAILDSFVVQDQSAYTIVPYEIENYFDKIYSRRTNTNINNVTTNFEPKPTADKIQDNINIKGEEDREQDVGVASVYGEANVAPTNNNVPLSARIKLDFLIQLQSPNNDGR